MSRVIVTLALGLAALAWVDWRLDQHERALQALGALPAGRLGVDPAKLIADLEPWLLLLGALGVWWLLAKLWHACWPLRDRWNR